MTCTHIWSCSRKAISINSRHQQHLLLRKSKLSKPSDSYVGWHWQLYLQVGSWTDSSNSSEGWLRNIRCNVTGHSKCRSANCCWKVVGWLLSLSWRALPIHSKSQSQGLEGFGRLRRASRTQEIIGRLSFVVAPPWSLSVATRYWFLCSELTAQLPVPLWWGLESPHRQLRFGVFGGDSCLGTVLLVGSWVQLRAPSLLVQPTTVCLQQPSFEFGTS